LKLNPRAYSFGDGIITSVLPAAPAVFIVEGLINPCEIAMGLVILGAFLGYSNIDCDC
jgi:hypothetical protein